MTSPLPSSGSAKKVSVSPGEVVDGRFQALDLLGRGGGGVVFQVLDQHEGRELALKVLAPSLAKGRSLTRFIREYRVASRLKDPRLVRAYHFGKYADTYYFTMDLVPGGSLHRTAKGKQLPPGVAVGLVLQLLSALDYLHHLNIIHRDIKPLNLLLDGPLPTAPSDGASRSGRLERLPRVRLTDFGIARVGDLTDETTVGEATGTLSYMAPEMLSRGVSDPRADLFAAGVVLCVLLSGKHPLSGTGQTRDMVQTFLSGDHEVESFESSSLELPDEFSGLLKRLLSRDPQQRPRTAALVFDELWEWWQTTRPPYELPELPPLRGSPYLAGGALVGREEELATARGFFETLVTSQPLPTNNTLSTRERSELLCPSLLVVGGPAGVGKSRLTWQILRLAARYGYKGLAGQCKHEVEQPYEGLAGVLRVLPQFDSPAGTSREEESLSAGSKDAQPKAEAVPETTDMSRTAVTAPLPLLHAQSGPSSPLSTGSTGSQQPWRRIPTLEDREYELLRREAADGVEAIKQHELRQRFFFERTVARLLRWAQRQNVLVLVEDVQWADPSTSSLLAFLVRAVSLARGEGYSGKIAFCLTHRPGTEDNAVHRLEALLQNQVHLEQPPVRLELGPLAPDHSAELVSTLLMEPLGKELLYFSRSLFRDRPPTPLYVEQALRILLYQGHLTRGRFDAQDRWLGQWNIDPALASKAQLPGTVQEAIGERASRLSVETQRLLALASVEGRQFTVAFLAHISDLHPNQVLDSLDEADQEGFVHPVVETEAKDVVQAETRFYRFVHDRYREALFEGLPLERRRELHLKLAQAIVALSGVNAETAESLAHHCGQGGDDARAFQYGVLAADNALNTGAFDRAADLFGAALAAGERSGLTVDHWIHGRYADACVATGAFDTAQHHYEQRIAALLPGPERWDTQRRSAELNYRRRDFKNAAAPLESLLREMGYPVPRTDLGYVLGFFWGIWRIPALLLVSTLFWRFVKERPARDLQRTGVLMRAWYMLTECSAFLDFRRCLYHGPRYAFKGYVAGDFPFRAAVVSSMCFGSVVVGLGHRTVRRALNRTLALVKQGADADTATVAYYLALTATCFAGATRLDLVGPALQSAEASGDIQRRFMARLFAWIVLHFAGRAGASMTVAKSIGQLGDRYDLPELRAWSLVFEGMELHVQGFAEQALEQLTSAYQVLEHHGDLMGVGTSRSQQLWAAALMDPPPESLPLPFVADTAAALVLDLLRRRLTGTSEHSSALGAAIVSLYRLESASPGSVPSERWRQVERLHRKARRHCRNISTETPVFLATGALLSLRRGRVKPAVALLTRAVEQATETHNSHGLMFTYRLAQQMYPAGTAEHEQYARAEAELLARLRAIPRPTFAQILEGYLGPGPWPPGEPQKLVL